MIVRVSWDKARIVLRGNVREAGRSRLTLLPVPCKLTGMIKYKGVLHDIQHLLLNLFQVVFHVDYQALDFGVIGFGAYGVDFPTHFLGEEL